MNYFELFEIPVKLKVDAGSLNTKYFELSRKFHPDYFVNDDPSAQADALERSAQLNKAYRVFKNPAETIKYVLQQKGLLEEEEKYELPPAFLMEVLEVNEQIMDADELSPESESFIAIQTAIDNLQNEIYEPVEKIIENYKEGITTEEELLQVKEYYYKKKYLDRIGRELAGKT